MSQIRKAACIGAGVIGSAWLARLIENGVAVAVYDPDSQAERKIGEVLENAERVYARLTMAPRPEKAAWRLAPNLAEAVAGANLIVESAPERLEVKRKVYAEIEASARPDALIASSTSGFKPTDLQAGMAHPERLLVAHPFNPVYLLPLVEILGGEKTSDATIQRAMAFYDRLGMKPLHLKKEIDAFVADRLMEALWREALWLVHDGVATAGEIDDAIRYGCGLRWAQMGTFQTFHIAGGEAGMRHFMAQFGPCLKWPWTKLMDTPELTDALVDRIADQTEAMAAGKSVRELERIRDDNLIAIIQALKVNNWGAGETLAAYERRLFDEGLAASKPKDLDYAQPLRLIERRVPPDWTDYNNHMQESRYLELFSNATDAVLRHVGVDADYIAGGGSYFTAETHIIHVDEVAALEPVHVETRVIKQDGKKLHLHHSMHHADGRLLATSENLQIHVDMTTRRASVPAAHIDAELTKIAEAQAHSPPPGDLGRYIGKPRG